MSNGNLHSRFSPNFSALGDLLADARLRAFDCWNLDFHTGDTF
jgi:hypothetical protein